MRLRLIVFVLVFAACASTPSTIPLPNDIWIRYPDAATLASNPAARFIGRWEGRWSGPPVLDGILVVERVDENTARLIYAWDESPGYWKAGWGRQTGNIVGDELTLPTYLRDGYPVATTFQLRGNNTLLGTFLYRTYRPAYGEFKRVPSQ